MNYYILDLETTGLDLNRHETTQLSLIRFTDRNQLSFYIRALHPETVSKEALIKTGRVYEDLKKGLDQKIVVEKVHAFVESDGATPEHRCFVGHNVSFDRRFSHRLWEQNGLAFPANSWLCTKSLTLQYTKQIGMPKPASLTLEACLKICGIRPRPNSHNAIVDTQNTYILLDYLLKNNVDYLRHIKRIPHMIENQEPEEEADE